MSRNHTGFYVAREKGLYQEQGLNVTLVSPHTDDYHSTPASHLASGDVAFAIAPSETVVSAHTKVKGLPAGKSTPDVPQVRGVSFNEPGSRLHCKLCARGELSCMPVPALRLMPQFKGPKHPGWQAPICFCSRTRGG